MPRNSQGLYTLPPGNPVVPNTLIESAWANSTMEDLAAAMTGSLPRDGSAPMTGPLTLVNSSPTSSRQAASKGYVDGFLSYATGMPIGSIVNYAAATPPTGFLLCDGSAVSRTTYADLFALIGTTFGQGDGTTTFGLPNTTDLFIRGIRPGRQLGVKEESSIISHRHSLSDPGHNHALGDPGHSHTAYHSHGISDPGHVHGGVHSGSAQVQVGSGVQANTGLTNTYVAATGITVQPANPATTVVGAGIVPYPSATGITMALFGGDDTYPSNVAFPFIIKALNDTGQTPSVTEIESSDENCISIDSTVPTTPILTLHTNVPLGLVKLDENGSIPANQLSYAPTVLLGTFDASGGLNPSEAYPLVTFSTGEWYIVGVPGTITVYDPVTDTTGPFAVNVGDQLLYIEDSPTGPAGWYWLPPAVITQAINVGLTPAGSITATNVQAGLEQLDTLKAPVATTVTRTGATGAAIIPAGSNAQRPAASDGMFRYNSEAGNFEGFVAGSWVPIGIQPVTDYQQGFKNKVINGGFQVWQRGVSFSATGGTADLWTMTLAAGTASLDRRTKGNTGTWNICMGDFVTRLTATAADGSVSTRIENVNTFSNQTVILSYKTNDLAGNTGAAPFLTQNFGTGGGQAGQLTIPAASVETVPIASGFFRKDVVFNIPSVSGKGLGANGNDFLSITIPFAGTFTAFFLFDVQLELGNVATPFDTRPVGETLGLCQRYYQAISGMTVQNGATPAAFVQMGTSLAVVMRATPVILGWTNGGGSNITLGATADRVAASGYMDTNGLLSVSNILLSAEL